MKEEKPVRRVQILVIALALAVPWVRAQTRSSASDRTALEAIAAAWQDAWNRHDVEALSLLMTDDVDFVTVLGANGWLRGRKEFTDRHVQIHQTLFKESVWSTKEMRVRFLRLDLAIIHVLWETRGDILPDRRSGEMRGGIFTWVVEKRSGKWLIVASQNTENSMQTPSK